VHDLGISRLEARTRELGQLGRPRRCTHGSLERELARAVEVECVEARQLAPLEDALRGVEGAPELVVAAWNVRPAGLGAAAGTQLLDQAVALAVGALGCECGEDTDLAGPAGKQVLDGLRPQAAAAPFLRR
jgi:hypothetical protein